MKVIGIIPARFASTRFPGKPLAIINGKSMVFRVYEQSLKAKSLYKVVVATDDERIQKHIKDLGGNVILTSPDHATGTERCKEAMGLIGENADIIINIQGDEPYIHPAQIDELVSCFEDKNTRIATLIKKIKTEEELFNPNKPKVIIDNDGFALYFSRLPIPYLRGIEEKLWHQHHTYYKHIGLYGYSSDSLNNICTLAPASLEKAESLEQLRWLENGYKIKTYVTEFESYSVDTPEDLEKLPQEG